MTLYIANNMKQLYTSLLINTYYLDTYRYCKKSTKCQNVLNISRLYTLQPLKCSMLCTQKFKIKVWLDEGKQERRVDRKIFI